MIDDGWWRLCFALCNGAMGNQWPLLWLLHAFALKKSISLVNVDEKKPGNLKSLAENVTMKITTSSFSFKIWYSIVGTSFVSRKEHHNKSRKDPAHHTKQLVNHKFKKRKLVEPLSEQDQIEVSTFHRTTTSIQSQKMVWLRGRIVIPVYTNVVICVTASMQPGGNNDSRNALHTIWGKTRNDLERGGLALGTIRKQSKIKLSESFVWLNKI